MKVGRFYQTPDISSLVQEVVGRSGWAANNDMVFVLEASHGQRQATTFNAGDPDLVPVLHIEYASDNLPIISVDKGNLGVTCHHGDDAASDTFTIKNTGVGTLNYTLTVDVAWMTLSSTSGSLGRGASDTITVTYDTDAKDIGTYIGRITITAPDTIGGPGAANSPSELVASLTVLKEETNLSCSSIPVYARDLASPALMVLLDVTGSMKHIAPVTATYEYKYSEDLGPIVQEIVNRSDWSSGNSLAFIMEGSGQPGTGFKPTGGIRPG